MQPPCLESLERSHVRHAEVVQALVEAARRLHRAASPDEDERDDRYSDADEDDDLRDVADAVAYFRRSVPRHFRDEEDSLFPRLGQRAPERRAELDRLVAEHPSHLALHDRIGDAAADLDERRSARAARELLELALELREVYEDHARREDVLFDEAARALTARDLEEIEREMEERRGRGGGGGGGMGSGSGGGGGGRGGGGGGGGRGGGMGGGGGRRG